MTEDRLITVAIHTYDRALALRNLLESEGVEVVLHNVNLTRPVVSSGVRVRIKESDLPLALRIIENAEIFNPPLTTTSEPSKRVLVPVDFSEYSLSAAQFAFNFAYSQKAEIVFLHSFINPALSKRVQLTDAFSFDLAESQEVEKQLEAAAKETMENFSVEIKNRIKNGLTPPVKFSSMIIEGVPEDVIVETAKSINPILIVMATRGTDRKVEEMIGSVTAEVLDSCRFPVFTIPENTRLHDLSDIRDIVFFSNLDQEDILALENLNRLLPDVKMNITVVHVPEKKDRDDNIQAVENLVAYCRQHYPTYQFDVERLRASNVMEDYKEISSHHNFNLVVLPNKKRSVFSRFFNPSLAHKLLLHADIPMMVIPV